MASINLRNVIVRNILAAACCALFTITGPAVAVEPSAACSQAASLSFESSLRVHAQGAGEVEYFELEVPEAGLVSVDVSTPGISGADVRIGYAGHVCGGSDGSRPLRIERSVRRLTFVVPQPGRHFLRVAAQDPRQSPGLLKVTAGFAALADLQSGTEKEEDEGVFEIDPDAKSTGPDKEEDEGVFEIDPDGNLVYPDPSASVLSETLCRVNAADDHGDTPGCATSFEIGGGELSGEIANAWGDDEDYFAFRLTRQRTVRLTTAGPADTYGSLYDHRGHRLAADDDGAGLAAGSGGDGSNFRIVKTLSPGLYFLRVEGSGSAEGPYRLRAEVVPW